eukprot:TRINITY_DN12899_c0_g1_i1.p1 TRINITY_DN12899_c0_g1~~TRINITY_DN12899_c0_g1_i1.p1  ORF type:complete len:480 (+),score=156.40 TRINITY_DN12899_c0_g1_i1:129-1568(+)
MGNSICKDNGVAAGKTVSYETLVNLWKAFDGENASSAKVDEFVRDLGYILSVKYKKYKFLNDLKPDSNNISISDFDTFLELFKQVYSFAEPKNRPILTPKALHAVMNDPLTDTLLEPPFEFEDDVYKEEEDEKDNNNNEEEDEDEEHDDKEKYKELYAHLKSYFLSIRSITDGSVDDDEKIEELSDDEILTMMRESVSNLDSIYDRAGNKPVSKHIITTYHKGLPLYRKSQPIVNAHTIKAMKYIFYKLSKYDDSKEQIKKRFLRRLSDAFTACQAEQGRVIDSIYGSIIGRDKSIRDQVLSLVDEQKERVLDQVTNKLNPDAWKVGDGEPKKQIPHLQSSYRIGVAKYFGIRGFLNALSDYCSHRITKETQLQVIKDFEELFDMEELVNTIIDDVNQQETDAERLIDRDDLGRWAGDKEVNNGFESHSIYYDEDLKHLYRGKPTEENEYQPYLSHRTGLKILVHLFLLDDSYNSIDDE